MASAPLPPTPTAHRFLIVREKLVDVSSLMPLDISAVRAAEAEQQVFCPTCRGPMQVIVSETGPVAAHVGENPFAAHEPEDPLVRRAKHLIERHLQGLFPTSTVQLDAHLPELGYLPDVALVNSRGGKVAVEYQAQELSYTEVEERCENYENKGIRCLWLLDLRRLQHSTSGGLVRKVMLGPLETALVSHGEPLIFLDVEKHDAVWVQPPPEARELAELGEKKIGRVECLLRRYRLGSLRVKSGRWWVDPQHDLSPPLPNPLPAGLQKKLDKRRASPRVVRR